MSSVLIPCQCNTKSVKTGSHDGLANIIFNSKKATGSTRLSIYLFFYLLVKATRLLKNKTKQTCQNTLIRKKTKKKQPQLKRGNARGLEVTAFPLLSAEFAGCSTIWKKEVA